MQYNNNTHIIFTKNLEELVDIFHKKIALLLIDKNLSRNALIKKIKSKIKPKRLFICDTLHPEPTNALINHTKDTYKDIKFEIIVAIGGGSIIDSAKAISIALTHKGDIWKYVDLKYRAPKKLINKPIDIFAVPTTSGTGSEVTKNSVLINEKLFEKATIKFDEIYPKTALMCPSLTLGLNKEITCYTALDAFAHALESRININSNLFSNLYATKAINIFLEYFPKAIKNLNSLYLREKLMQLSLFGGLSIKNAGTTTCHQIAQPLTARTGIPHGLAVAILTIPVLKMTLKKKPAVLNNLFDELNFNKKTINKSNYLLKLIEKTIHLSSLKLRISYYYDDKKVINLLTKDTLGYMSRGLKFHPVQFSKKEIMQIITDAY